MGRTKVIILGAGTQAKYILETFSITKGFEIEAIIEVDKKKERIGNKIYDIPVSAWDSKYLYSLIDNDIKKAIIAHGNNGRKEQIYMKAREMGLELVSAIHPASNIASTASIGKNAVINAGAIIQPYAKVGNGVMVHAGVIIEHDCVIEDFVNLAPGVQLAGGVRVKKGAYIFIGASIIPNVIIGSGAVIGAGAVVIRDVPDRIIVAGNPAKQLSRTE